MVRTTMSHLYNMWVLIDLIVFSVSIIIQMQGNALLLALTVYVQLYSQGLDSRWAWVGNVWSELVLIATELMRAWLLLHMPLCISVYIRSLPLRNQSEPLNNKINRSLYNCSWAKQFSRDSWGLTFIWVCPTQAGLDLFRSNWKL